MPRNHPPSSLLSALSGKDAVLRLSEIARMTTATADPCRAFILGLLSLPGVAARAQRQGLTLLWLDPERVCAALVFRDSLYALATLSFPALFGLDAGQGAADLVRLLDDFRLGWLPEEAATRLDGAVWRASDLPPEAEGFKPLFACGPNAGLLAGKARIMPESTEDILRRGLETGGLPPV